MREVKNIILVGVGGQGTILASKILSAALVGAGYDVKMSEVHGMAQRGGSVTTQVRYGEKVHSPVIGLGEADVLVSFESMEALRWLEYLKPSGKAVVNRFQIPSVPILMGRQPYPDKTVERVAEKVETKALDAFGLANEVGNPRTMNLVLLGALAKAMDLDAIDWPTVIRENVKPGLAEVNIRAFEAGYNS